MEEEKLLYALMIFLFVISIFCEGCIAFASSNSFGTNAEEKADKDFAITQGVDARKFVIEQSKLEIKNFLSSNSDSDLSADQMDQLNMEVKPQLLVFVSTSMPATLLKNYYKEASKYGGILVFKGLPNGNFKELIRIITDLQDGESAHNAKSENKVAGAIIDDESFSKFGIEIVPSVVLVQEEECFDSMSCKKTFDKVVGNLGIRGALQQFELSGDMKIAASKLLEKTKRER